MGVSPVLQNIFTSKIICTINNIANYITIIIIMLTYTHNIIVMSLVPIDDIAIPASALLFQNHCS